MKKLLATTISIVGLTMLPALSVSAQTVNVDTDGPGSGVVVDVDNENTCNVNNENNVDVNNENDQNTGSGDANTGSNTGVGDVNTGDSNTDNDTNVGVVIDNGSCNPETTTTEETPVQPGQGAGTPAVLAATTTKPAVAALPDTGNNVAMIASVVALAAGTAFVATAARLGRSNG